MCRVCMLPSSPRSAAKSDQWLIFRFGILIAPNYLFDVRDKSILKDSGEYFIGDIQRRNTHVVVAVQPVSLRYLQDIDSLFLTSVTI